MPTMLPPAFPFPPDSSRPSPPGLEDDAARIFGRAPALVVHGASDPYGDDTALLSLFKRLKDEAYDGRVIFERAWWRNLLYTLGRQWIYYDSQRGQWADKRMAKWIPRPVTNKISETISAYMSVFQSVQLATRCRPSSQGPTHVTTAEIADRLEPSIHAEHSMDAALMESDYWFTVTGNVFWHPYWDKRKTNGSALIPYERCGACQKVFAPDEILTAGNRCPACQAVGSFAPALDETGTPIGTPEAPGAGATDILSPFEIALPGGYRVFSEVSHLIRSRWRTKQYCEATYGDLAKTIKFDKMPLERSMQLLRALATTGDSTSGPTSASLTGSVSTMSEGITEYELWLKPCRDFPEGLFLRLAGEAHPVVLRMETEGTPGPLPYHTSDGDPLFPWIHCGYEHTGGRIWARSPLDTLISKQDQINQLDSLVLMIITRTANPIWLEPKGAEVKKFTGEPGLVVKYNPLIAGGEAKPTRIPGENIPPTLMTLRQSYIADLEALAGTSDVLKGQRPPNVEAFSALQLLVERSQSRFGPALAARGAAYRDWYALALELEREFGPVSRLVSVLGPNQEWTLEQFRHADLLGDVEVIIEDGSQAPKTSLGNRAAIEQLNQLGFLDKTDPEQRYAILKTFGKTDLLPSLDNDVKSALQEQDDLERWAGDPSRSSQVASAPVPVPPGASVPASAGSASPSAPMPLGAEALPAPSAPAAASPSGLGGPGGAPGGSAPLPAAAPAAPAGLAPGGPPVVGAGPSFVTPFPMIVQYWHKDALHNAEHRKWANSDAGRRLFQTRPELAEPFTLHMQTHDKSGAMKALVAQNPLGMPAAAPPQGGALAMQQSNRESGSPADVPSGQKETAQQQGPQ